MKALPMVAVLLAGMSGSAALHAAALCPAVGGATDCDLIITVTDSGTTVTTGPSFTTNGGTYDGSDDTLIGIQNLSSSALSSINLSSTSQGIFGFDGDGIDTYNGVPGNSLDTTGYGGPNSYFTNYDLANPYSGTVNFVVPLAANGGNTYFSLEEALTPSQVSAGPTVTPEPNSLILLGTGLVGVAGAFRRRFVR